MGKLQLWGLATLLIASAGFAQSTQFGETTTGSVQEKEFGISAEEIATLDKTSQEILTKFKNGRVSSFKDVKSRYSGHLEMHDEDLDGLTDHRIRKGQQNLEGQTDEAAFGSVIEDAKQRAFEIDGIISNDKQKDEDRIVNNVGNCKNGYIDGKKPEDGGIPCQNISANILDAGPAHGQDVATLDDKRHIEKHRFVKVSDKAAANAKKAGENYGNATIEAAGSMDADALRASDPNAKVVNVGKGKTQIEETYADGTKKVIKIAPDLDLLRSEYAWLEEQKKHRYDQSWKTLRASRLAGGIGESYADKAGGVDDGLANMVASNASDDIIAKNIVERQALSTKLDGAYCIPKNASMPVLCSKLSAPEREQGRYLSDYMRDTSVPGAEKRRAWDTAKNSYATDDPDGYKSVQKEITENLPEAKRCLGRDVWCQTISQKTGTLRNQRAALANKNPSDPGIKAIDDQLAAIQKQRDEGKLKNFVEVKGDVGAAFTDTREFVNARASRAWEGPVDQMINTMKSADFNERIDQANAKGAANGTPWADMVKQVKNIQKIQADLEKDKQEYAAKSGKGQQYEGYKGTVKFNKGNFNTSTQSVMQMFGVNRSRDGRTLVEGRSPSNNRGIAPTQRPATSPSNSNGQPQLSGLGSPI